MRQVQNNAAQLASRLLAARQHCKCKCKEHFAACRLPTTTTHAPRATQHIHDNSHITITTNSTIHCHRPGPPPERPPPMPTSTTNANNEVHHLRPFLTPMPKPGGGGDQFGGAAEMNCRQAGGGGSMRGKLLKEFVFTIFF